jgi:hypothetical protein
MVTFADLGEAWCSGLTCSPVKAEIAGSNPVASAPGIVTRSLGADICGALLSLWSSGVGAGCDDDFPRDVPTQVDAEIVSPPSGHPIARDGHAIGRLELNLVR